MLYNAHMRTKIKKINYFNIKKAVKLLSQQQIIGMPTETVYGLAANCFSDKAVLETFTVKNRQPDNPLIVHISPEYNLDNLVLEVNDTAKKLMKAFWPGPMTLVFKSKQNVSKYVSRGLDTLAIRMPSSKKTIRLLKACPFPLSAPSANSSGRPSPTSAKTVYEDLKGKIPLILDGGKCDVGIESTVIDVTTEVPIILRPGIITQEDIDKVIQLKEYKIENVHYNRSPGTKYKHYAPRCDMIVVDFSSKVDIRNLYDNSLKEGKNPVILCLKSQQKMYGKRKTFSLGKNIDDLIKNFYTALRVCEKKYNLILFKGLERVGKGASMMNRVDKSCGGKIV